MVSVLLVIGTLSFTKELAGYLSRMLRLLVGHLLAICDISLIVSCPHTPSNFTVLLPTMTTNKIGHDANSDDKPNLQGNTYSADELSPNLRDYLLRRHGTVDLDPIPMANDADL
jgi:hypothetical protein